MKIHFYKLLAIGALIVMQSTAMAQESLKILYTYAKNATNAIDNYKTYDSAFVATLQAAGHSVDTARGDLFYYAGGSSNEDRFAHASTFLEGKDLVIHGPDALNDGNLTKHIFSLKIPVLALDRIHPCRYGLASNNGIPQTAEYVLIDTDHPAAAGSYPPQLYMGAFSRVNILHDADGGTKYMANGLEKVAQFPGSATQFTTIFAPVGTTTLDPSLSNQISLSKIETTEVVIGMFGVRESKAALNGYMRDLFKNAVNYTVSITEWNGTTWSNGTPSTGMAAIIADDYTGAGFKCRSLRVAETKTATISSGTLEVTANVYNDGSLVIESGASLLTYDGEINVWEGNGATIERTTRYAGGKYSFVGSPVASDASITGSDLGTYVYSYNETTAFSTDGLARWENASTTELVPGIGYAQAGQQNISFIGVPNSGDVVVSGTYTQDNVDANEGWNLIANPYAAAISVTDFLSAHTANLQPAVYIWDDNNSANARGDNDDYIVANGSGVTTNSTATNGSRYNNHIGSMQGFFVQLIDGQSTDITFADSMKVSGNNSDDNFFRKASNNDLIRVNLTAKNGLFKQTVIGFPENASDIEKNSLYDAPVFSKDAANAIFTAKGDKALAIQGVSKYRASVDMMVNLAEAGTYTIAIQKEGNVENTVFLRDKLTNELISLEEGGYTFTSSAAKAADRFEIIFESSNILASKNALAETLKVSIDADKNLKVFATNNTLKSYNIYNLMGSKMATFNTKREHTFNASNLKSGVYIISDGSSAIKFIIR